MRAFKAFGGVPKMIRYDNFEPAVIRIALGRERFEHPRFVAMRFHYGYDFFELQTRSPRERRRIHSQQNV